MESRKDRNSSRAAAQSSTPTAKKRFRIERLEERIAPKKGGSKASGGSGSTGTSGGDAGIVAY